MELHAHASTEVMLDGIKREQERNTAWAEGFLRRRALATDEIRVYISERKRAQEINPKL
jgi:hypothetical protein